MKPRIALVASFALALAACGGNAEVAETQPTVTTPITTTLAPTTTVAPSTSSTTQAPTSTTAQPAGGGGGIVAAPSAELKAVRAGFAQTELTPPSRVEGLIEIRGVDAELGELDLSIPISTSLDPVTGDGHMSIDFSEMMEQMAGEIPPELAGAFDGFEVRQIGDTAYLRFGLFNAMFGVETEWLSMPVEAGEGFTREFSSGVNTYDATSYLDSLENAGGEVSVIGTEELRGVATTHYRALFDLESLAELDPDAYAELRESAPVGGFELPMDIWIDESNQVQRFLIEVDDPELDELNPGESFEFMRIQFDFADYGGRVTVEPPPPADVTDVSELEDMFGSFFEGFDL